MKDGFSQTSDESLDESSDSSKEDEFQEKFKIASTSGTSRPSSRSILGRLTSAHIRQFVSPDYKQDFQFHVPSLALAGRFKPKAETSSRKFTEKIRNKIEMELMKGVADKSKKYFVEKAPTRKLNKEMRKMKKNILDRICSPTLSFILKTRKDSKEGSNEQSLTSSDLLRPPSSPCERFNRRNSQNK